MNGSVGYPARIEKEADGTVLIEFVDLPLCTNGADELIALEHARDAFSIFAAGYRAKGVNIPPPSEAEHGQVYVDVPEESLTNNAA